MSASFRPGDIGDVTTLGIFAWKLYKACKEASEDFENVTQEVVSLHITLKETEDCLYETGGLSPTRDDRLASLIQGIKNALQDLEKVLGEYEKLGTREQRTWVSIVARKRCGCSTNMSKNEMHMGVQSLADARKRIISNTTLLGAFNQGLSAYVASRFIGT